MLFNQQVMARPAVWSSLCGLLFLAFNGQSEPASSEGFDFFEKQIRPVLVDHCYSCHSAKSEKLKGDLRLDTREGLLQGGASGPAIVPGDPDASLLIKAIRYADEHLQMPPKDKKLSAEQIAHFETWIRLGAPDPRIPNAAAVEAPRSTPAAHWAFQPVQSPALPAVENESWVQSPIDAFILAQLESRGLRPSPKADKRTLIRRVYYDLIGLPPTPSEVAAFAADESSEAFQKVVESLLASPRYGERWGRYWLDVARYADTKGYVFEEERKFPFSYTYRDYVIRSLNEDLPFDQFIIEQIAADLLPLGEDQRPLAALGFLTLGRRFLNNQHDIIDDRIDVVTRGFMGLTVTCARCHDHKYDPVPIEDYYALYGVFASSSEPSEKPLLGVTPDEQAFSAYQKERKVREKELNDFRETKEKEAMTELRVRTGDYLLAAYDGFQLGDPSKVEAMARERKLNPGTVQRWMAALEKWKVSSHPVFTPWFAFSGFTQEAFASQSKDYVLRLATAHQDAPPLNTLVRAEFAGQPPHSMKEVCEKYGRLFADVDKRWNQLLLLHAELAQADTLPPVPAALADPQLEALREILYSPDSPVFVPPDEVRRLFDVPTAQKLRALQRKLDELEATHPGAPPRAMALADNKRPHQPRVFLRGNPNNPGSEVPRRFLTLLAGPEPKSFQHGSGRLELAQAIASPDNPLTARVIVNRVWLQYFGAGLVRTPSDFGLRAEPPSHPELLDYLASRFMRANWSLKALHRWIVLSSAYQQSSDGPAEYAAIDPNNTLLWKMNRRRMDLEAMRDSLLAVSARLDLTAGGRSVDILTPPYNPRRTIYGFIERQNLPGFFRTFDLANPDTTSPHRFVTTVPQQALYMINSPFALEQARHLARRAGSLENVSDEDRVRFFYQTAFQRNPEPEEIELGLDFIKTQSSVPERTAEPPLWQYGYGAWEESESRLASFHALPHFTGKAWQGGPKLPDEKLGWALLNASGGHPGNDPQHAVVRRWTAPADATVSITGQLSHGSEQGDGVQAMILSNRQGLLGGWHAFNGKTETLVERLEVQKGDQIDFVTTCRDSVEHDSFEWAPEIRVITSQTASPSGQSMEWSAKRDFSGPKKSAEPLSPWEKYAQVLLMSNELVFID